MFIYGGLLFSDGDIFNFLLKKSAFVMLLEWATVWSSLSLQNSFWWKSFVLEKLVKYLKIFFNKS